MRTFTILALVGAVALLAPASALAQDTDRAAVTFTAGLAGPSASYTQTVTFEQYSENGSLTSTYSAARRPSFDGGVAARLWHGVGFGVALSYFRDPGSAQVTASIPNPLVFDQPRMLTGAAPVTHAEFATHLQATWWMRASPRVTVVLSGGPTVFEVTHDFVTDVAYTQDYPYTTATYDSASTVQQRTRAVGFNAGADAGWRLGAHFGLAGTLRYSHASVEFTDTSTGGSSAAGGIHLGGGIRLAF